MVLLSNSESLREKLREKLLRVDELRAMPFDNSSYDEWRITTGKLLTQVFGKLESEPHPCVQAFLAYHIPKDFTATRSEMQEFYQNILGYQSGLLAMYLEDIR